MALASEKLYLDDDIDRPATELVTMLGGVNDTVSDVHGDDMRVCRADDGVDSVMRFSLLRHRLATLLQPAWLPSFTREGFTVREVPGRLMGMINIARMKSMERMEEDGGGGLLQLSEAFTMFLFLVLISLLHLTTESTFSQQLN